MIVFYNKRARVSAFPYKSVLFGENSNFPKEGNETRHLGFYNTTLNALTSQKKKNFYDHVVDRTHSSSKHEEEKNINTRKDGGVFRRNHQRRGGESLFSKPRRTV